MLAKTSLIWGRIQGRRTQKRRHEAGQNGEDKHQKGERGGWEPNQNGGGRGQVVMVDLRSSRGEGSYREPGWQRTAPEGTAVGKVEMGPKK